MVRLSESHTTEAVIVTAIHMISAWAAHQEIALGQLKIDNKSNEITAIPKFDIAEETDAGHGRIGLD